MARFTGSTSKKTSEYQAWLNMKARCYWSGWRDYHRYGGRGIRVCERWKNSFDNFLADMGNKPSSRHQLDRIDNDGNYETGNCQWVLPRINARNRCDTRSITYQGKAQCLSDWANDLGIRRYTLSNRLNRGISFEQAIAEPERTRKYLEHNGKRMLISEWADYLGVSKPTLYDRFRRGWSVERALTTSVKS